MSKIDPTGTRASANGIEWIGVTVCKSSSFKFIKSAGKFTHPTAPLIKSDWLVLRACAIHTAYDATNPLPRGSCRCIFKLLAFEDLNLGHAIADP